MTAKSAISTPDRRALEALSCKWCPRCARVRHFGDFTRNRKNRLGLGDACKACATAFHRALRLARGQSPRVTLAALAGGRCCAKCGKTKPLSEFRPRWGRKLPTSRCRICLRAQERERRSTNAEKTAAWRNAYVERNRERLREKGRQQQAAYRRDPVRRLRSTFSSALANALSGRKARRPTFALLGYSLDELTQHLERQFLKGMSWDNYGTDWHVDHIVPVAEAIKAGNEEAMIRARQLPNLRPLWAKDNVAKSARRTHLL